MKKTGIKFFGDFPVEYYTGKPKLEFYGNDECVVDGLKSVVKYTSTEIVLNVGKMNVKFLGDGLLINAFSPEGAIINGFILSTEFSDAD